MQYFEVNPWGSSLDEIYTPFDFMASLCLRKMICSTKILPIHERKNTFNGYHSGWSFDVHKYYHTSFRSFVFLILLHCSKRNIPQDNTISPSSLPREVCYIFCNFLTFHRCGFWSFLTVTGQYGNHLKLPVIHQLYHYIQFPDRELNPYESSLISFLLNFFRTDSTMWLRWIHVS